MFYVRNLGSFFLDEIRYDFILNTFSELGSGNKGACLLDLGCGEKPFQHLYENKFDYTIGIDVPFSPHDKSKIDVFSNGVHLPFKSNSFDAVLCSEVMEHIPDTKLFLSEMHRVLKPNGILILTVPFMVPEHEAPYDFFRFTRYGIENLLSNIGFKIAKISSFGELFGVLLSFFVQAQIKLWRLVSIVFKKKVDFCSLWNPFVIVFIYLPQWLYIKLFKLRKNSAILRKIYNRFDYSTKGFGVIASKVEL